MIIPVVVGALCTVSTKFEMWLKKIKINISIPLLQKACPYVKGKILQQIPKKLLKESPLHLDRYQTYKTGSNIYTKLKLNYINNNNQDLEDLLLLSSKKWYIFPSTAGEKAGFASYYIEKLLWKPVCQILVSKGTLAQAFHLSRFLVTNPTNLSLSHQQRITIIY